MARKKYRLDISFDLHKGNERGYTDKFIAKLGRPDGSGAFLVEPWTRQLSWSFSNKSKKQVIKIINWFKLHKAMEYVYFADESDENDPKLISAHRYSKKKKKWLNFEG